MFFKRYAIISFILFVSLAHAANASGEVSQDLSRYEGRNVAAVEIALDGVPRNAQVETELLPLVRVTPGNPYRAVQVHDSLVALWESGAVANARVEVTETSANAPITVRFLVRPQARVASVNLELEESPGTNISEDELRSRLNLLEPGARATESVLRQNADAIQAFLRDRGFYQANVDYTQQLNAAGTRSDITFRVRSGAQARVENFNINISGFNTAEIARELRLQPGAEFSQRTLGADINRIRAAIIDKGYLAPQLDDPKTTLDSTRNTIGISLTGSVGPRVDVRVVGYDIGEEEARKLLPVRREGSIDQSVIVEGERRLRNELQENGYFFAEVSTTCNVTPALPDTLPTSGEIGQACELLNPEELSGRNVAITYNVDANRRFRLTDIRIEGTDKLTSETEDIRDQLRTKEANALAIVPFLGYGRGYTSLDLLEQDRRFIEQRMRELGYRRAEVEVRQGVSLDGENLVITFAVDEGALTRIASTEVRGNQIYATEQLKSELRDAVARAPFSRVSAQADGERLLALYARNGYTDTTFRFDTIELPRPENASDNVDEQVRLVYTINEGDKVFVNRIFINGNARTTREAIIRTLRLEEGDVLRADRLTESERALYATDAFRLITIRTEEAGETASGFKRRDIIIDVEERLPRVLDYGGGYSTDAGPLGLFELRNTNLFGQLRQGALRVRASQRRQLLQLEYFDPRFMRYGGDRQFAPLVVTAQYSRDTNVTRFFRSTIDQGSNGIVQRIDAEGNPVDLTRVDENGNPIRVRNPTINRATFNIETRRDFEPLRDAQGNITRQQSTFILRYTYEDVRLFFTESLLLRDILRPDRTVRLSRFATTFARDTRDSQTDATRGQFFNADYSIALRELGGNISFSKFQTNYRVYRQLVPDSENRIGRTVLSANFSLGLANIFKPRDRNGDDQITAADRRLPISERFFTGGSTTLRGFAFDEAGPRIAIPIPEGEFFNNQGEPIQVFPFTVPVGGNALLIANLEARIPITRRFQLVPFYDGGNIYDRVGDIFRKTPREGDTRNPNFRAEFTHTVGLGLRLRTPFGPLAVDYGFLLNPPQFVLPNGTDIIRLRNSQFHIRFGQAF